MKYCDVESSWFITLYYWDRFVVDVVAVFLHKCNCKCNFTKDTCVYMYLLSCETVT